GNDAETPLGARERDFDLGVARKERRVVEDRAHRRRAEGVAKERRIEDGGSHGRRSLARRAERRYDFHLIEQPIEGVCAFGPWPVFATATMASNSSRRASGSDCLPEASSRPRY